MAGGLFSTKVRDTENEKQPTNFVCAPSVTVLVNHPKIARSDSESSRRLPHPYYQYVYEIVAKGKQLEVSVVGIEELRPVDVKFSVDTEFLKSTVALNLTPHAESYEELTYEALRS